MFNSRQNQFLRILLNQYHPTDKDAVVGCLPEEMQAELSSIKTSWNDPKVLLKSDLTKIQNVHYSWLLPIIQQYPENLRPLFAEALPSPSNARILSFLKYPAIPLSTTWGRYYLVHQIVQKMKLDEITPVEHLPPSLLSFTLELSKEELIELIDFLGLYDLAEDIRRIVDKNQLKKIYDCLSIKKQHFLRSCLLSKEKVSAPSLELDKWGGEQGSLEKMLHKRGIVRLGKGLSGQTPDFIWHITHRLDSGRAGLLSKYILPQEIPGITPVMIQEIQNVHNFFKKMGPA